LRAPLGARGGEIVGHHRFKITVDAVIEAPLTVPNNQDPSEATLEQVIGDELRDFDVGGTYQIKVDKLKVKKTKADA
jgi:hypothetical protein